ncbi:MAG: polymorphic toxin type 44 domain-containing protein, partial [Acidobacteria bacterium]|nr:polymorphic toxin type 44 domain-containing protein [Acidobacteriota bacterium]
VWTTYTYDVMGRTTSVTAPDGSVTSYLYAGNTLKVTDPAAHWKKYTNDAFGNLIQVNEPKFAYDSAQQLQSATNPESGTTNYSSTAYGRLEYKTDATGNRMEYSYDAYNRITQKRQYYPATTEDLCRRMDYYWDTNPYTTVQAWGQLTAVRYGGTTCRAGEFVELYQYTGGNLPTRKEIRLTRHVVYGNISQDYTTSVSASYEYNNEGALTAIVYPDGTRYYYALDTMGRPVKLTTDVRLTDNSLVPTDYVKDVVYGPAGELLQWKHIGAGYVDAIQRLNLNYYAETRSYNDRLQMKRLTASHPYTGASVDLEYRYNTSGQNNGEIMSMKDYVTGEDVTYTYDKLNRLTKAETVGTEWGQSYTFDGFGNLTAQTVTKGTAPAMSLSVDGTTNRVTTSGFSYYANGNMATMPNWQGSYDKEGRLVDVTQSLNGTEAYEYDAAGLRIWTSSGGVFETAKLMFYGPDGKRLAKCDVWVAAYPTGLTSSCGAPVTYFLGQVVAGEGETAQGSWGHASDRLGSVRAAPYGYWWYDQGVTTSSYFPYGQARTGGSVFGTYLPNSTTGTMYAMHREYSAVYGRFLTPDPYRASGGAADPGSWNRYGYTRGDPVNLSDPTGLIEHCPPGSHSAGTGFNMYCVGGDAGVTTGKPGSYTGWNPYIAGTILDWDDQHGRLPICPYVPNTPDGVSVDENIEIALRETSNIVVNRQGGIGDILVWFFNQVKNNAPWDYKQGDKGQRLPGDQSAYDNFGNFNYGATGAAIGIPETALLRFAGWAQQMAEAGTLDQIGITATFVGQLITGSGQPPYGDDANDQGFIKQGIKYWRKRDQGCAPR